MASYLELDALRSDSDLLSRLRVAVVVVADGIIDEIDTTANHVNRLVWAKAASRDPAGKSSEMMALFLANQKGSTVADIQGLTDNNVKNKLDRLVDIFAEWS